jgi:hypothetical protein
MIDIGPFPSSWFYGSQGHIEIQPWFPLPSNLINKGEEWIPEIQENATVCVPISVRVVQVYENPSK